MPLQDTDPTPSFGGFGLSQLFSHTEAIQGRIDGQVLTPHILEEHKVPPAAPAAIRRELHHFRRWVSLNVFRCGGAYFVDVDRKAGLLGLQPPLEGVLAFA